MFNCTLFGLWNASVPPFCIVTRSHKPQWSSSFGLFWVRVLPPFLHKHSGFLLLNVELFYHGTGELFFLLYLGSKKCTCHCAIWWCKRFDKRAIQTNVCRRLAICAEILPTHFCAINCAGRLKLHTHANLQVLLLDANFAKSEIFLVFLGHQNYNSRHLKWYYKGVRQVFFLFFVRVIYCDVVI